MKKPFIISTDSTADIPAWLKEKYNIEILPLYVTLGEKSYLDGVEITNDDIEEYVNTHDDMPATSAVDPDTFLKFFKKASAEAEFVIHFSIGSGFSCTCQNARLMSEDFDNIYIVDTECLCVAEMLLVYKACELAQSGKSPSEIIEVVEKYKKQINASFVINKLDYLRRGGRCSAVAALGANMLNLKPSIELKDNKLLVGKKYRGNLGKIVPLYIKDRLANADPADKRVIVASTRCEQSIIDSAVQAVKDSGIFDEVVYTPAGSTIFSHCGPATLGIMFIDNNKK